MPKLFKNTADRREYMRKSMRRYRAEHPNSVREEYIRNAESHCAASRAYYQAHKDEINKRRRERRHEKRQEAYCGAEQVHCEFPAEPG